MYSEKGVLIPFYNFARLMYRLGGKEKLMIKKAFAESFMHIASKVMIAKKLEILVFVADKIPVIIPVHKPIGNIFTLTNARLDDDHFSMRLQNSPEFRHIAADFIRRDVMQHGDNEDVIDGIIGKLQAVSFENLKIVPGIKLFCKSDAFFIGINSTIVIRMKEAAVGSGSGAKIKDFLIADIEIIADIIVDIDLRQPFRPNDPMIQHRGEFHEVALHSFLALLSF
jgi:hypothetical protein